MRLISTPFLLAALVGLLLPAIAWAQPPMADAPLASLQVGPLALEPRLIVNNLGVDTNVFNLESGQVRDFTFTAGPELDSWIRVGRLAWAGTSSVSWNYFRTSATERSFNVGQAGRVQLDLGHIVPFVTGRIDRGRQRPNLEIDARVDREIGAAAGGVDILLGAKTTVSIDHGFRQYSYGDEALQGVVLATTLDRREITSRVRARYELTPLTTMSLEAAVRADEFRHLPSRDGESQMLAGALEFRPLALIAGRAQVGVRRFVPDADDVPDFTGVVSDVQLSYQLRDWTRFVVSVQRDLDYSYELQQAYYVSTGMRLSLVQALGASWDVVGRAGRTNLDYRARARDLAGEAGRRDFVTAWGGGVGRRLGTSIRVGFELDFVDCSSNVNVREYEGLRGGATFSYGF